MPGTQYAAYCSAMAHWRLAEASIAQLDSMVISTKTGQRVHPLVRIASQAANDALRVGSAFGLSPISRCACPAWSHQGAVEVRRAAGVAPLPVALPCSARGHGANLTTC